MPRERRPYEEPESHEGHESHEGYEDNQSDEGLPEASSCCGAVLQGSEAVSDAIQEASEQAGGNQGPGGQTAPASFQIWQCERELETCCTSLEEAQGRLFLAAGVGDEKESLRDSS